MRCQRAHLAADAEIGEYLIGEQAVGVLVVGGVASARYYHDEYGGYIQRLGEDAVPAAVACRQGQQHEDDVGEQEGRHGCQSKMQVAKQQARPLAHAVEMEDAQVTDMESHLCGRQCTESQKDFQQQV